MLKLCIACSSKVSEIDPLKLTIKNIQFSGLSTKIPLSFSSALGCRDEMLSHLYL